MKLYVEKRVSKKEGHKEYVCLYAVLPYKDLILSFDRQTILEFTGISFEQCANLKVGEPVPVGQVTFTK